MANNDIINIIALNEAAEHINVQIIGNIAVNLAQPIQIVEEQQNVVPRNRNYYEEIIPLYMGDLFTEHFRMSRASFEILVNAVQNAGNFPARPQTPLEKKLLFTLWVLAKPETFLAAGDRFGIARSTAHYIFQEIVNVINNLLRTHIVWPQNHAEAIRVFNERSNGFPGVIGTIDGCHIPIKQPINNANDYYNRKQFHSIILQGICDHRMIFIDIFVGMPGRMHDARVYHHSPIYRRISDAVNPIIQPDMHIIGDSAYPLSQNLSTPFRDNGHLNDRETNYNNRLSSIRSVIERAYGRLKGKFRRLKYLDIGNSQFGCQIIAAACILHNFIILNDNEEYVEEYVEEDVDEDDHQLHHNNENIENDNNLGIEKRQHITNIL